MLDFTEKRTNHRVGHEAIERASNPTSQNRTLVSCMSQRAHQLLVQRNSDGT